MAKFSFLEVYIHVSEAFISSIILCIRLNTLWYPSSPVPLNFVMSMWFAAMLWLEYWLIVADRPGTMTPTPSTAISSKKQNMLRLSRCLFANCWNCCWTAVNSSESFRRGWSIAELVLRTIFNAFASLYPNPARSEPPWGVPIKMMPRVDWKTFSSLLSLSPQCSSACAQTSPPRLWGMKMIGRSLQFDRQSDTLNARLFPWFLRLFPPAMPNILTTSAS